MNTNIHPDQLAVMNFKGASMMLKRTCDHLTEVTRVHHNNLMVAAEEDYEKMFTDPDIAARTLQQIEELESSLIAAREELANIEAYWNSLPWAERLGGPDPRRNLVTAPQSMGDALLDPLDREDWDAAASLTQGVTVSFSGDVVRRAESIGEVVQQMMAEEEQAHLQKAHRDFSHTATSFAKPEFDPELLAAKHVTNVEILADVRTRTTAGKSEVKFVIGGPPVVWLTAGDGTKVAVLEQDFARMAEIFSARAASVA